MREKELIWLQGNSSAVRSQNQPEAPNRVLQQCKYTIMHFLSLKYLFSKGFSSIGAGSSRNTSRSHWPLTPCVSCSRAHSEPHFWTRERCYEPQASWSFVGDKVKDHAAQVSKWYYSRSIMLQGSPVSQAGREPKAGTKQTALSSITELIQVLGCVTLGKPCVLSGVCGSSAFQPGGRDYLGTSPEDNVTAW